MPLKRTLSLTLLSFYGLGTILGAGVYALIGEVAQQAEQFTPWAFLVASFIALLTAISYAELSSRYPQSAGSALYIRRAFNRAWLSGLVGWLVVLTGVVSAATIAHGFAKYAQYFFSTSPYVYITLLVMVLGSLAIWGIYESATLIMIMTIIEVSGLLLIIFYGREAFSLTHINQLSWPSGEAWRGILIGAFIAFYAYIGFEDMVNTAEETIKPEVTLPRAIFLAVIAATLLYILVAFVLITTLPRNILAQSSTPLISIVTQQGHSALLFSIIALIAIMNGLLVQIIMASRLIYGMSKQNNAPKIFSQIAERTQTPVYATLLVMMIILLFAYALPITTLAKLTSTIMLCVFITIHTALIKLKLSEPSPGNTFTAPIIFPMIAILLTLTFLFAQLLFR